jgi:hypothetical protein
MRTLLSSITCRPSSSAAVIWSWPCMHHALKTDWTHLWQRQRNSCRSTPALLMLMALAQVITAACLVVIMHAYIYSRNAATLPPGSQRTLICTDTSASQTRCSFAVRQNRGEPASLRLRPRACLQIQRLHGWQTPQTLIMHLWPAVLQPLGSLSPLLSGVKCREGGSTPLGCLESDADVKPTSSGVSALS